MEAPAPPHKSVLLFTTGSELLLRETVHEVLNIITDVYDEPSPFVVVTDNYGRTMGIPVHLILMVREP